MLAGVGRGQRSEIEDFFDTYRTAFAAFDAAATADLFAYPVQITSTNGQVSVTAIPTREAWLPQIERLVGLYRELGVRIAEIHELQAIELAPRLAAAVVRWGLVDEQGKRVYEFDAVYTLADLGEGLRITAIAHNETRQLRARMDKTQRD